METIALGTTGRTTTRLGYGCSSLMAGMGRRESLAILESAFDAGVRHFDVAPMYGFGEAESCLGDFLTRHSADVTVTTKYGIPPAKQSGWMGFARSLARPLVKAMPGLKGGLVKAAGKSVKSEGRANFTAAQAKESLERSLAALRVSRIDVWLLHEAVAADLQDDRLLRLLEDCVAAGTVGAFGVGSDAKKIMALRTEHPEYCRVMQFEWSVMDTPVPSVPGFRIHHRALTHHFRELHAALMQDKERCTRWSQAVGMDLMKSETLAALMLKAALTENPASVILFSSKKAAHLAHNVEAAGDAALEAPARRLYALVREHMQEAA